MQAATIAPKTASAKKKKQSKLIKSLTKRKNALQNIIVSEIDAASMVAFSGDMISNKLQVLHSMYESIAKME